MIPGFSVSRSLGLRAEIIIHLVFLVGAALLLGGFLLLRLGEKELVDQRVEVFQAVLEGLADLPSSQELAEDSLDSKLRRILHHTRSMPGLSGVELWLQKGSLLTCVASDGNVAGPDPKPQHIWAPGVVKEPRVQISYPVMWPMAGQNPEFLARIDVPIQVRDQTIGMVRGWLSLQEIVDRLQKARRLVILYAFLYGVVILLFGIYLLNRHVVKPTARLLHSTIAVAAGNLDQHVLETGPREITALARAFNSMVAALKESRVKTAEHINSLRHANEELAQTRDELVRSARMATVGHLAAGMAHEIGNPLTAVMGYLALLKSELLSSPYLELVEWISNEASRIDQLVRDLLDYASPTSTETQAFDPVEVFRHAIEIVTQQGKISLENLEDRLPESLPTVCMVRHHLLQVFINLLLNARDALTVAGKICLTAGQTEWGVWLSIADNGSGIDEHIRQHIFDPFFTTKEPGKGRGLGLAVCYRVIKEAGGIIDVVSEVGQGTEFVVRLPALSDQGDEDAT